MPTKYDDVSVEERALQDGVTRWDVGVEQTEGVGPDAGRLLMAACRVLANRGVKAAAVCIQELNEPRHGDDVQSFRREVMALTPARSVALSRHPRAMVA